MSFPLALVVTISCEPSGEKATWPGVWGELGGVGRNGQAKVPVRPGR